MPTLPVERQMGRSLATSSLPSVRHQVRRAFCADGWMPLLGDVPINDDPVHSVSSRRI